MKFVVLSLSLFVGSAAFIQAALADSGDQSRDGVGAFSCGWGPAQALETVGDQIVCVKTYQSQHDLDQMCRERFGASARALGIMGDCLE